MRLYTIVFRSARFLAHQARLCAKFLPDSELVVVNNGPSYAEIAAEAERLRLRTLTPPKPADQDYSKSHAHAWNWTWKTDAVGSGHDAMFLDMDLVPISAPKPIGEDLAGIPQVRGTLPGPVVRYLWPGCLFLASALRHPETISVDPCMIEGVACDTGGALSRYMETPGVSVGELPERNATAEDMPARLQIKFDEAFHWKVIDEAWLHYLGGSNWRGQSEESEQRKQNAFFAWLEAL